MANIHQFVNQLCILIGEKALNSKFSHSGPIHLKPRNYNNPIMYLFPNALQSLQNQTKVKKSVLHLQPLKENSASVMT